MTTHSATLATLSGRDLRDAFVTAAAWLDRNAEAINAINVFPVPDGDTGTNMAATLRAAASEAARGDGGAGDVSRLLARGALMGARGNSGVILSQYLRGIADRLAGIEDVDGEALAAALEQASDTAWKAVQNPKEGTILTVAREAGEAARRAADGGCSPCDVLEAAMASARTAVERTPELLPVLKEAGVVDSGGMGLCVVLEGALYHVRGQELPGEALDAGEIRAGWIEQRAGAHDGESAFGYCTEFVVRGLDLDEQRLRADLNPLGDSLLVVGDSEALHVHIHTDDPGAALTVAVGIGRLMKVKVDDMDAQAARLAAGRDDADDPVILGPYAVVAVAAGDGLARALRGAGATRVVAGGQTMNPSTRDLLDAIQQCEAEHVIVLPNNKNIVWTADQAATLAGRSVLVVPTISIPQGLAALLALNPDDPPEDVRDAMSAAAARVYTIEITNAARGASVNGVTVREGEPIALLNDELRAAAATPEAATLAALDLVPMDDAPLITIYRGADTRVGEADALAAKIRERLPEAELTVEDGGQPFYRYVISVE